MENEKKLFYKKLATLGVPILVQNLITSCLNFIDVFMVGQLGETAIAAVGIGNRVYFLFIMMVFAISGGTGIFAAQFWGKKDIQSIKSYMGTGYICALGVTLLFTLSSLLMPEAIIGFFNKDPEVIHHGSRYLWIVSLSNIPAMITIMLNSVLRSTEEVKIPMYSGVAGIALNTGLNYLLIFGKMGVPAMGVEGAAWATLAARTAGTLLILVVTYKKRLAAAASLKELLNFDKPLFVRYIKTTLPILLQNSSWAAGSTMYSVIYSRIGTSAFAAVQVVSSFEQICLMFFSAMGHAARTMIGNRIGEGEKALARTYAWKFLKITFATALIFIIIIIPIRSYLTGIYNLSDEASGFATSLLLVMALGIWTKAGNIQIMMGPLHSGGDTKFSMLVDTLGIWCIGVPLAWYSAFHLQWPIYFVAALILTEEVVKLIFGLLRLRSGKWIKDLTTEEEKYVS